MRRSLPGLLALSLACGAGLAPLTGCGGAATVTAGRTSKERLDFAVNRYYARDYKGSAAAMYGVLASIPEADLAYDGAQFYLAASLVELGAQEAGIRLFFDIISGRRSPEFAARALTELDGLTRRGLVDESALVEVLFGQEMGNLSPDTDEFVNYYQALGEFRHGFDRWAARRLGELAGSKRYYGWRARYALAVLRLQQKQDEGAEAALREMLRDRTTPPVVRNAARTALARLLYEKKDFVAAARLYDSVDAPLPDLDVLLLEQSWTQLAANDERRALGMLAGLEAPVYRRLFAPEKILIRALALRSLCQYRLAHLAVTDYRRTYEVVIARIRDRGDLKQAPILREAAMRRSDLVPSRRVLERLEAERGRLDRIRDGALRKHLGSLYALWIPAAKRAVDRELDHAVERLADSVLTVNEQMDILEYELGIRLFRQIAGTAAPEAGSRRAGVPIGSDQVYFRFDGEYWSDELRDYAVWVFDRCVH